MTCLLSAVVRLSIRLKACSPALDGTPVIGVTAVDNLFLNTGHGTLGWTMACGSGQVIADVIGGATPAIDTSDLSIARYAR